MSAIGFDAPDMAEGGIEDAEAAYMKLFEDTDAKEPSEPREKKKKTTPEPEPEPEADDEDDASPSDEEADDEVEDDEDNTDDADDEPEEDEKPTTKTAEDDAKVIVKVNGVEQEFTVGSLKRLAGQEQALTAKSEEVATTRKVVEETGKAYMTGLNRLLDNARARAKPYAEIDFLVAAKDLSGEELQALRSEAEKNFADVRFLESELEATLKANEAAERVELGRQANQCIAYLSDPAKGIPGWNEQVYNDLRSFAITQGIPAGDVNRLVDPISFKILHSAMLYEKGKTAPTIRKDKTAKKIVKSSTNRDDVRKATGNGNKAERAKAQLARRGDTDSAANAFLANWEGQDD